MKGSPRSTTNRIARFLFGPDLRLRKRSEFLLVQRRGRKQPSPHFIVISSKRSDEGPARAGVTVSRKVGNAVHRNRIKRCVREFVRLHHGLLAIGHDFVFVAKSGATGLSCPEIARELGKLIGVPC